jgi:hypothetical protein
MVSFLCLTQPISGNIVLFILYVSRHPEHHTIVRQHDQPTCFHIILAGTAIVNYMRIIDGHVETLEILHRGCTFGVSIGIHLITEERNLACCYKKK